MANVLLNDHQGNPVAIDEGEVAQALKQGYSQPSQAQHAAYQADLSNQEQYGDGILNPLEAGTESALGVASLGASRKFENAIGLTTPEAQAEREARNPISSRIVGPAAGIIGPLLVPGVGEAAALKDAASAAEAAGGGEAAVSAAKEAASNAFRPGDLLNPVQAVSKVGRAVSDASGFASEGSGLVAKVLSQAGAGMAGSAVEASAYGLGQSVNESALGDPDLNGEKVLANIGHSALLGGAVGGVLGGLFGGVKALSRAAGDVGAEATPAQALRDAGLADGPPPTALEQASHYADTSGAGSFRDAIDFPDLEPEAQNTILAGLKKLKPNADDIVSSANDIGAPVPEGLISGSEHIQKIEDMLVKSPTPAGIGRAQLYQEGYEKAAQAVSNGLGSGTEQSLAEVGNQLKNEFTDAFEAKAGPIKELYSAIDEYAPAVPLSDKSTNALSRTIGKIIDDQGLVKGTPEHGFVETFSNGISDIKNLQQLKNFRTALGRATGKETQFVSGLIKDKLDNVEQSAIRRYAETMKTPVAKDKILGLLDQIDQAKSGYRALREDMGRLGKNALGRSKIYGPQDFLNAIEEQTPEKFASRLFSKNNSEFLGWINKNFPDQMDLISQYQKSAIRQASTKDGVFQPRALFKELSKLSPEVKNILFKPEELAKMKSAETYLNAFPKNFNPSGTSSMEAYRRFFSNPISATIESTKDYVALGLVKGMVSQSGTIQSLASLERMGNQTTLAIQSGARSIFNASKDLAQPLAAFGSAKLSQSGKKSIDQVQEYGSNPEKLIHTLADNTHGLYQVAPNLTGGLHQAAIRATQFLSSKAPQMPQMAPLSPKLQPSQAEIAKFQRYHAAVENPVDVLKQVNSGMITPEAVETLQTVYPKLYSQMKLEVMDQLTSHVAKNGTDLPYAKKLSLSLFLGQDMDSSLTQPSLMANQVALAKSGQGKPGGPAGMVKPTQKGLGAISSSNQMLTAMQESALRGKSPS